MSAERLSDEGPTSQDSCFGCSHYRAVRYRCQGDSGYDKFCTHPDAALDGAGRAMDEFAETPRWCPFVVADIDTLTWLRAMWISDEQSSGAREWRERHPQALAVLDKLIARGGKAPVSHGVGGFRPRRERAVLREAARHQHESRNVDDGRRSGDVSALHCEARSEGDAMKAIICEDKDAELLLAQLRVKKLELLARFKQQSGEHEYVVDDVMRAVHYILVGWLQDQGFKVAP